EEHRQWVALYQGRQVVELELELAALAADYLETEARSDARRGASPSAVVRREGLVERWEAQRQRDVAELQDRMRAIAARSAARRVELDALLGRATCAEGVARA
ncbi:MAG TPA: hypothetical protein VEU33_24645, partial [Archangium sp.]|nr:hypothetical protein [Archangium sp.]